MKMHVSLRTADLERSVSYYRTLLNAAPVKHFEDYALFVTSDPALELALDRNSTVRLDDSHFGVAVDSTNAVEGAISRLQQAGFATHVEREETCCYAKQTKVWSADPDGRRWEVYAVHEETDERDDCGVACCGNP